jgi:hypothetical protein
MQNPSGCLVVNTTYLMPASFAAFAQLSGSELVGLKSCFKPQYHFLKSSYVVVVLRSIQSSEQSAHDSVIPGTAYQPQCRMTPNFRSCHLSGFAFACG